MYYVYVLLSKRDGKFSTGSTGNVKERVEEHNRGYGRSTKNRRPFKLIYYEACLNKEDAMQREKYLKSGMGKKYLKNHLKHYLSDL